VPLLQHEAVEVCGLLCLSTKHDVVAYHELSRGTLDGTVVHPRDVFRSALLANAASVIVGHNHPSGDPTPSPDDVRLTDRLSHAAQILNVELMDHVIVGDGSYYSFREAGRLRTGA
jgi:DNA repair protein RadC